MADAAFGPAASAAIVIVSVLGIAANAKCVAHVRETFPVRKAAVFFLAFYDGAISLVGNAIFVATFVVANHSGNLVPCVINFAVGVILTYSGLLITAEIAAIRYLSLLRSKKNAALDEKLCFKISLALHVGQCALLLCHSAVQAASGGFISLSVTACTGSVARDDRPDLSPLRAAVLAWVVFLSAVSLFSDASIVVHVWRQKRSVHANAMVIHKKSKNTKGTSQYSIPVKATAMSLVFLVLGPAVILTAYKFDLPWETRNALSTFCAVVTNAVRCPLLVALTFSAKARADQESRAKRQERERQWAKQEREERLKNTRKVRVLLDDNGSTYIAESTV